MSKFIIYALKFSNMPLLLITAAASKASESIKVTLILTPAPKGSKHTFNTITPSGNQNNG